MELPNKKDRVPLTNAEVDSLTDKNLILTHNHPMGTSFSSDDLMVACKTNAAEMRVATMQHRYSILRPEEGWDMTYWSSRIEPVYSWHRDQVYVELRALIDRGALTVEQANMRYMDMVWERAARDIGLAYNKYGI